MSVIRSDMIAVVSLDSMKISARAPLVEEPHMHRWRHNEKITLLRKACDVQTLSSPAGVIENFRNVGMPEMNSNLIERP